MGRHSCEKMFIKVVPHLKDTLKKRTLLAKGEDELKKWKEQDNEKKSVTGTSKTPEKVCFESSESEIHSDIEIERKNTGKIQESPRHRRRIRFTESQCKTMSSESKEEE